MQARPNSNTALVVTIVMVAIILATANVAALIMIVGATGAIHGADIATLSRLHLAALLYFVGAPLLAGSLLAWQATRRTGGTPAQPPRPAAPPPPSPALALRLLGLLQQEARLVDFVTEDIDAYSDDQVGAAVRAIHAGCRKVLNEHIQLQRIFAAEDGSEVVVEQGFDSAAVRLTGNVTGNPPFRGTLQHSGWRATNVTLPDTSNAVDPAIIAPAEVEIA